MSKQKQRNVEAIYALSPMQQGMLFHSLYDPEESLYVVQCACTLSGEASQEALQQAWQEVVNRHSVLRTFFAWQGLKEPVQIVRQHVPLPWLSLDWRTLAPELREQQLAEFRAADVARGFDLQHAPLMRLALIRVADDTYHLVWSFHHLLLDGWSTPLVIKEVFTFYEGISQGRRVELGAVRPYREYIRWLHDHELGAAEQFWRELLRGFSAPTMLGIERRIETHDTQARYVEHQMRLTAEATAELQQLARTHQVTLNTVLQGAWALLLSRYSGSEDVVFGTTVSGRPANLAGVEEMVGLFINTLPVRVEVKNEERVGEYLRRLQEQQVEVRHYEYSPLVEVQRWSEVPKGTPLFESLLAFENYPIGKALGEQRVGLEVRDVKGVESNNYPLTLIFAPGQELTLRLLHNRERYETQSIERMMEHLQVLLQGLGERPTAALVDLSLLTAAERRHLLLEWNETAAEYPLSSCIHHLFEAQVRRSPDAVAARSVPASLTFAELDARANQLAHYLLESGIGPQAVVALLLDHCCETLIAILGVLKAGCAYLPLDPSHPPARMAFALADAQAALLITTHSLAERLGAGIAAHLPTSPPVLSVDKGWDRCATLPATAVSLPSLSSSTAAYLIYTSGSTGLPKGVVIEHASLVNYICWAQSMYLRESAAADCALYSSLAFDLTVTSLFLPLVTGNTVHLYPPRDAGPSLLEVMEDNRCQLLKLTPSHLALIRDVDNRDSQIRCLIVGGEALSTGLAHAVSESFGHQVEIYNEYGPTEATVGCMLYRFDPETEQRAWVPIGRPAANTQIYILDQRLEPTAGQVTGELYIGGAGVARGYLGRAELTAERFVPDPFSGRAGGQLYRTGDRARRLADGNVEYLGRNDEQVKYHGYRVELNELRLALSAHGQVQDAMVVVRKDGAGGREQLVGYYVSQEAIEAEELRQHMQERVIAETVPQWFVHLRWLPLTLNGKVNVEALPAPWVEENGDRKEGSGEPRTEAEAQLVAIWREVLGREQVGIDDNFYELGGDSILSIQIIARANRAGLQLTPRQLFKHPTVAGLATVAGTAPAMVSEQGEVSGAVPLTPIQHWFFEQELAAPAHYNQSLLLQTRGPLQAEALKTAVRGLLRQHDAMRLRFERGVEGEWRQWHAPLSEELVEQSCTVIELSNVADEELGAAVTATADEVQRSLDLQHGPVLRVVWLEPGAGRSGRLLLVAHHLVVDGVSWRVLLEDLERGYEQAAGGQAVELGAKTSSYSEWAEALVAEAEHGLGTAEEQYWTAVAGAEVADIPGGNTAGSGSVAGAERVEAGLSAARTRELLQEVPAAYNTQINDVLVTALARTLSWWTTKAHGSANGAGAVLVEMEGHGREEVSQEVDVSRTAGWFTSIYPVVLESRAAEEAGAALKRVKEQLRAVPRHGLGFGLLRYLGNGEVSARLREMRRAQVGFNYLGQLDQAVGAERWLGIAGESGGAGREASGQRVHAIEVSGYVAGGELRLGWEYDGERYQRAEMELVAGRYKQELEELIAHCVSEEAGGFTPSDFPLADLSQQALDRIAANDGLVSDIYTLTPLQAGLLFHSLYTPASGEYFVQLNCTLSGKVSPAALQQAWQEVVDRHSVLRTFFVWQDLKEPVQIVRQHVPLPWLSLDWRAIAPAQQQQQLSEFLAADVVRGFDLQHAPLMRLALIRVTDETYHFVWSFHHLLLDGWSKPLVIKEVFTFYEGLSQGRAVELGAVQPYREYIRWLRGQDMGAAEQFWRELLKGFSAPTALGIERRASVVEEQYEEQEVRLTAEATAALQQLAGTQQVTLNTVVQGAWALLLSRYSGSKDVVFGATVSGRPANLPGVEEMVGMFINTLPVRVAVQSDEGVGEYLRRLQEQQVEVRQYEYSPLVEVQRWSEVPQGTPLFETLIAFENYPVGKALEERSAGLEVRDVRNTERSSYPLVLVVIPAEELTFKALYDSQKYDAKTIRRIIEHLEVLLQGLGERPTAALAELSLLTEAERRHLLLEWNETAAEYPLSSCIHHLFEAQVRRSPDAVAVCSASVSLTFAELDQRANQLAHFLVDCGIGPQAVVALLLDHSCETLIAILGVLKAGCAYLPLDPSHPPARMAFALGDAQAALLITTHSFYERLGAGIAAHLPTPLPSVLSVDTDWQHCAVLPATAPSLSLSSATAAYVIYTSGSTGIPKGVVIEHSSLVNYICWAQSVYLKETVACALYSSLAFDLTVTSVFLPLVTGNTVHLYLEQDGGPSLLEVMEDNRCQLLKLTPSHLALIRDRDNRDSQIRCLIVGGEALSTGLAHAVSESFGHQVEIYNEYGPTEATVGCMIYRFDPETEERAWVPIGRPAANTQIYILDERLEPTAEHVTGELYIGGAGVARGYLGRAELTAERFIPDPFSGHVSARLYRTGDRAQRLADGNIEYLGRNDEQVKYHGYRVELNELRLALSAHAKVRDAVVVVRKDSGREQLVGYYVGREAIEAEELRRHMQERVIAETVPQWFVPLQWLPLTLNGKVNVEALPAPWVEENGDGKEGSGEPRTEAEVQLVAIWREVLGREQIGMDDNFFELGGDSILSIQIIARANRAGLQLTPRQLFKHPTVAELAAVAGTAQATVSEQGEVSGAVPLTPIQHWFFEQELAVPAHYNQSLLLQTRGPLQAEALKAAVRGLLLQHDALRLRFEHSADGWRQWHAPLSEELVEQSCTVIDLSGADEELEAAITAAAEAVQRSLDLQHGSVLRVVWLEPGAGRSGRLLLVAHHLVVDGVSWRVLLEDLERGYEQAAGGQAVELGTKTSSYREWAEALVAEVEHGLGTAEEQYWTGVARAQVMEIPGGNTEGGGAAASAERVELGLSAARTQELLQEVPAAYNTQINDVLVTALARTLSWWTTKAHGSANGAGAAVLVELEGHGREEVSQEVDVSRTAGWFTSIYPVVLESRAAEEAGAALKRVKEQLRAVPRHGLGFGLLRYLGNGEASACLREMRRAQVGFNYLGQLDQVVGAERWLGIAEESRGAEREVSGQRVHAIEVSGYVAGGELRLGWEYDGERYERAEMEAVAGRYKQELEELIAHCVSEEAGGFTPSDFPLADLSQQALDRIAANDGLVSDIYTLAPLQAGLLFHSLYTPASGEYFVQLNCTLSGKVSPAALQQAWQEVVNRHSVLRTFFVWQDLKEPVQIVRQHVPLPWLALDWRALAPAQQQQQLSEFLAADVARGFDLQHAPLMRLALIQVTDETYHLVWSFHHLLLDGWSKPLVIKEVFTFYEELSQGRAVELGAVQPYREYIRWLRGQDMPAAEQFWRELLKDFSVPTALGVERVVSTVEEQYEQQEVRLTAEATAALQQLAGTHQVTLNTVVQGAWALLLSRYSGSEDVVFGTTVSGRPANLPGVEEMVGLFINTLPVRVAVKSEERIGEYLRRLQEQQVEVRQYEYSPLVEVQRWSEVGRGVRLFDTIMVFENYPVDKALRESSGGIEVRDVHTVERNNYPLALVAIPLPELALNAVYNSCKYGAKTITRMMEHLQALLEGLGERPTAALAELSLLTEAERRHLLLEWNETAAEYPLSSCIHHLFEAQVRRSPDAVAARSAVNSLTFSELDERANQLARYVLKSDIRPQAVVALLLDHSCETLIALLGVLKAGCAYLPLDPSHPPARMAFALADAQAALLITTHSLAERLGAGLAAHLPTSMPPVLSLDREWEHCALLPSSAPSLSLSSATAAYVIYTSGSTGIPKGVVIEHSSLVNYICWAQSVYLKETVACALYSSLAFDLTVTSVFLPLVTGNTVHLYPQQKAIPALLEVMEDNRCQLLKLTPSHLALIRDRDNRDSQIRCLIVGGEALSTGLAHAVSESFGHQVEIYNEYGPTEATVGCMLYRYDPETEERAWVPIGRPAANTQIYVLDQRLETTAEHVTGELYIGGAGVARGYLGRAELTAERFVPDPFSGRAGARVYRTGDRARWLADGNIEYLGRNDEQVKYHGYRVELNELRLALSAHAKVRDAVVVLRKDSAGGREQLVGYYVSREAIEAEELRRHMQERVIAETVPHWYVHLRRLPLTLNGKVNVEALPAPWVEENGDGKEGSGEPRTEAEAQLVAIWREVLGRERVRIDDNFFELGGDSILSIQIIARANRAGLQLMPRQLFQHPTVARLAAVAGTAQATVSEQGEVSGGVPLTPIQHWFFEQELAMPAHYNQSLLLQTQRQLQAEALKAAVRGLLRQHDALRLRFERGGEGWRQWHTPLSEELVEQSCTVIELSSVADEELGAAITATAEDAQRSLDLEHGPVLRVVWMEPGGGRSGRLLLAAHHLVVDGVSWRVLLEDLERGYEQAASGQAVALGAKTSSYREWAEALVAEAGRGLGAEEEQYWTEVAGAEVADIPGGNTAGSGSVAGAERVEAGLSAARTRELLQEVPAAYNTQINDVLVTALARTLSWWTKQSHSSENGAGAAVLVEMEGHGREEVSQEVDVSRTAGWFTSIYPVVLESRAAEEAGAALKRVKEQLRAVPRRGLGFGLLRYLGSGAASTRLREMRRAQVGFNYLGQLDQVVGAERWLGIAAESRGTEREASGQRVHAIEVSGYVAGGELQMGWEYDGERYERAEMEAVAARYRQELEQLIAHCVSEEAGGFTPSDFPLADLSQQALDRIAANDGLISDIYTLTPLQAGLLFHSLYTPASGEYFVQLNCTLSGKVSPAALQQAWQEVVNRHSVLRTFFVWQDLKEPVEIVRQHVPLPWLALDWRALAPAVQQQQLAEFLAADRARGFDLQHAPLMRLALIQVTDETYHFVWSFHHLLLDGWSTPLVIKEVFTFYEGLSQGRAVELGAVRPYREYIRWLRGQEMPAAEQFWRELLKDFSVPTALGIERVVSVVEEQYEQQEVRLTAEATAALQQLAGTHQVTLNTVVQGAWALLLSRYSGSEDVVFGTTVSGRPANLPGVEEMVGMFINTLPVRVAVQSEERIGEYLRRLQEQQVEVRQYEYSPLVEVQRWSEVGRGVRLFDTIMVFENYPVDKALRESSGGIEVRDVHTVERNNYPLGLVVLPGQQIALRLEYNTSRYEPASIGRMLQHLIIVLGGMSAQPEPRIADVPLLTITEEQQILFEWNETATEYPRELSLSELFEAQAARTPEDMALLFEDTALTYRELNERANQLARYLQRTGVRPEVLVGILMQRSVEMIVAVLGILKAGGAYVPLDPSYPLERLVFMVQDSGIRLLLTRERLSEVAGEYAGATLSLNEQWDSIAGESTENLASGVQPENLACVIYTSDSTRQPKGVMIQQRSVVNLATALQHSIYREYGAGLRIGLCAPLAFDASVRQMVQLLHGHALCVLPEEARSDAQQLLHYIKRYRLDGLDCTPSNLKLLGASGLAELLALAPQLVLVGGEALDETVWSLLADSRETRFFNIYGPTECTVVAAASEVRAGLPASTIGRPLANVKVYVLDQRQQPVGIGIAGEIYIGGEGVGRGYLNQPELTAERFIPHPYSSEPGARLYRTGDAGRYLKDRSIELLGRFDDQVKLRGFRIEFGEIEAALSQHPAVRQAVLMVREDQPGDKRLACYIVAKPETQPDIKELRHFLRNKLPDHMIPTAFMMLESLPLNSHGKVERGALPAPDGLPELDFPRVVPRTEVERDIAEVWQKVLRLESVGIFDNFFDLGGHSLLMVQVHDKLRERFKFDVSLVDLFEYPSINSLAEHLSRQKEVTPIQDENLVLATKLREGRNRLRQQRATRA